MTEVHLRLKIGGQKYDEKQDKIRQFHRILKEIDRDWPYVNMSGDRSYHTRKCAKCGGRIYGDPKLSPQDLKTLGKQLGLRVKIMRFAPLDKCYEGAVPPKYVYPEVPEYATL